MAGEDPERWFVRYVRRLDAEAQLFCLPYAGAGASAFRAWPAAFGPRVEVLAAQRPGCENRIRAPLALDSAQIAAAIKLDSRGPVLYVDRRVGVGEREFGMLKFRTMVADAEARLPQLVSFESLRDPMFKLRDDPRVTRVGRVLRRTSIDELPQLVNVLRGEMSLVGPRPERPEFVTDLTAQIPFYGQRHIVRPGLTGWAQVRYTYGATTEDALQKLQYDLYYVKNNTLLFDLAILLQTAEVVFLGKGR